MSVVTSNWLAEALGVNPRFAAGFQGYGQIPGSVTLAVNAVASGAADVVVLHRALHNPPRGRYHTNPMTHAAGRAQWTAPQGFWGPLSMIALPYNEYLQRYGASRGRDGERRGRSARERRTHPVVVLVRATARPSTTTSTRGSSSDPICMFDCDIPVDGVAAFVFTTAERARDLPHPPVYVAGYAQGHPHRNRLPLHWPLDDIMDVAAETCARLWEHSGLSVGDVDLPQVYDGFSPFVYFWLEALGYCPDRRGAPLRAGRRHRRRRAVASPCCPAVARSATAGCTASPRCSSATSSSRGEPATGSSPTANVGLACHSSPHWGGAVLYSREPL